MISKPWLDHYDEGIPKTLEPYPRQTLVDVVDETTRMRPDHTALIFKGERISYGELTWRSDALAAALVEQGIRKGDRVAILMPNCPQYVIAEFAIWKAGGIVASINPLYTERELEHALNECGAETVIVLTLFYNKVKAVQAKTKLKRVIATNIREYLPKVLMAAVCAGQREEGRAPRAVAGWRPVVRRPDPRAHRRAAAAGGGRAG